ncbi:glycosyltransferase [Paraburkholderia susongensis]|uniref:Glycosyltransferase family 28 C-terminal domain-containing protein n=1 Tax=Paraburkholderia susongensis TaxID=1515439 RepID=A0A1X7LTQ3_9BURK|nr:glycosyltransferase [Paraburkholderia susongensis]SMG56519.1 Glycosyltransferase family 28 C-terminal domain-containing protein [Paraburkholderia susongensis]
MNRCLSYARQMRSRVKPVFFSLAAAIEIIEEMGFDADYFVSSNWSRASSRDWNRELCVRLGMMLERVAPEVVVFDGTWPYQGFIAACERYGKAKLVWSNRGLYRAGKEKSFSRRDIFSLIVRPGEVGDSFAVEDGEFARAQVRVPPVCILDEDELLDREQARSALGLPLAGRYALFSLGAGNINDVESVAAGLIRQLQDAGFEIVWARNPISVKEVVLPDGIRSISAYPLVRYMRAFDVFVGAAGYNTCCEVVQTQVPSLLVPNTSATLDDQLRRAQLVAGHAPVVVSPCTNETELQAAVVAVLDLVALAGMRQCPVPMNGAEMAAEEMLTLIDGGRR